MEFISTTATAAEKLKRLAKTLRKTSGTSLAVALDTIAKQHGYVHWKHVTVCVEQTASILLTKPLPDGLKRYLEQAGERHPASEDTQKAFAQGFVFAMDVKDAGELSQTDAYVECDDGWYIAAQDLWRDLVHYRDHETGTTLLETQSLHELVNTALDDLQNYRFFRQVTGRTPQSLEEAYKLINEISFFPPSYIWINGKSINIGNVDEIRVDGEVVLSSGPGSKVVRPQAKRTRLERFGHLLSDEERRIFDNMKREDQEFWLFQAEKSTAIGKDRYIPLTASVQSKWKDATPI